MIRHCRYVLAVPNLQHSADYYRDVLGFEVLPMPDSGWRFFRRDDCVILAGDIRDTLSPDVLGAHSYFAYLEVDGVDVVKPLRVESWGMAEFGIRTIDGHRIMFGSPAV
jgi:catechol 2,3-dioxygenase-like lactoylglutathione lyase family enzyme